MAPEPGCDWVAQHTVEDDGKDPFADVERSSLLGAAWGDVPGPLVLVELPSGATSAASTGTAPEGFVAAPIADVVCAFTPTPSVFPVVAGVTVTAGETVTAGVTATVGVAVTAGAGVVVVELDGKIFGGAGTAGVVGGGGAGQPSTSVASRETAITPATVPAGAGCAACRTCFARHPARL